MPEINQRSEGAMLKYGWIAAWTLDGARQRLASVDPVDQQTKPRFSASPMSTIQRPRSPLQEFRAGEDLEIVFSGFGPPEYNGLIFEATTLQWERQSEAYEWLTIGDGKEWVKYATGVNLIQVFGAASSVQR